MDGTEIHARLVVGADGARSFIRELAGVSLSLGQSGLHVLCQCQCGNPLHGTLSLG
jgi:2-polyprenyl-6-methoxyphenol hydroxylase-like FAD-dependent oxidoreductase